MIEVFFTRPGNEMEIIERIKLDVQYAKRRVLIAQNYLTHRMFSDVVEKCNVQKFIILDHNSSGATFRDKDYVVFLGHPDEAVKSLMHHKFIIIDDFVWAGSLNASGNAGSHWDQMMRISDEEVVNDFLVEFKKMFLLGKALGEKHISPRQCIFKCLGKFNNPLDHYQISVDINRIEEVTTIQLNGDSFYSHYERVNVNWHIHCKNQKPLIDYRKNTRCENCQKLIHNETINKLEFFRTNNYKKTENNKRKSYSIQFLCLECLYDVLDDNNFLNNISRPEPKKVTIANLSAHKNQEIMVESVDLKTGCTLEGSGGFKFTVTKDGWDLIVFVPKKNGITQNQFTELFHQHDIINLIGVVREYRGEYRLMINNPNDIDIIWSQRKEHLRDVRMNLAKESERLKGVISRYDQQLGRE